MTDRYEIEVIHPATERWLIANHYQYVHHKRLSEKGDTVDFFAWNDQGDSLLVECKTKARTLNQAIVQLLHYASLAAGTPGLALPSDIVTDQVLARCSLQGILVCRLDVEASDPVRSIGMPDPSWAKLNRLADHYAQHGIAVRDNRGLPSLSATVRLLIDIMYEAEFPVADKAPTQEEQPIVQ